MRARALIVASCLACVPPVQSGVNPIDGCVQDADCPSGYHCAPATGDALTGNACQLFPRACSIDAQCDPGQSCQSKSCLPANRTFCQPCGTSADCAAGGLCVINAGPSDGGGYCSEACTSCPSPSFCQATIDPATGGDGGSTCIPTAESCNAGNAPQNSFAFINANVFQAEGCTGCHVAGAGAAFGNLDLVTNPYEALLGPNGAGAPASNVEGSATGLLRVDPGDPAHSFLFIKLGLSATSSEYGEAMPPLSGGTPSVLVNAVGSWIDAGAPND